MDDMRDETDPEIAHQRSRSGRSRNCAAPTSPAHTISRSWLWAKLATLSVLTALLSALLFTATPVVLAMAGSGTSFIVRKDVKDLTKREKAEFVSAVLTAKNVPSPWDPKLSYYDQFVQWHRDAFKCKHGWQQDGNWAGAAHNSPTFLPWHRQYLILFEQMLRTTSGNPDLALPYWDWTNADSTAAVFSNDLLGPEGDPAHDFAVMSGPFRKGAWSFDIQDPAVYLDGVRTPESFIVRRFNVFFDESPGLPTAKDVKQAQAVSHYDHAPFNAQSKTSESFRNTLEGWRNATPSECTDGWLMQTQTKGSPHDLHNLVHIYTGGIWKEGDEVVQGTMAYNTSPNDPIFFLHHANVDRIWAAHELASGGHYRPKAIGEQGFNGTDTMWPWRDRTINSWFGTIHNGYTYKRLH